MSNTCIAILLDSSGSMGNLKMGTMKSINDFISEYKQANNQDKTLLSLYTFSSTLDVSEPPTSIIYDFADINECEPITYDDYITSGMTGLCDAQHYAITDFNNKISSMNEQPNKVIFIVITDGYENASHIQSFDSVKELVNDMSDNHQWKFVYLGANQDSFQQGSQIGIPRESSMDYDATDEGIYTAFSQMTTQIISYSQDIIQDIILTE
tara:strand:- start:36 stop:665 length:630 start_codon:yes stop_codon:yes gene_type:complete